ncbi:MAG: alpha/beta hydrolase [Burkholderiaceae bacterium]|nr:MAG: alpha/beta hydrolase [Burkholderiaceae bacterium]
MQRRLPLLLLCLGLLLLPGCGEEARPDLMRLYQMGLENAETTPVILIPGVFGSKLRDKITKREVWPGPWYSILFSRYDELALEFDPQTLAPKPSHLEAYDIAEQAFGRDFYRPIIETLTRYGGYVRGIPGRPAGAKERRYYVFAYDWRQDNVQTARALDQLIETIRRDYGRPDLRVNIVAHSMGGLIARYYLRYGTIDALDGDPHQVTLAGARKVRKLILLGTPNLGSIDSLHAFLSGNPIGWGRIRQETLATLPSGYQLFPHPLTTWLIDIDGHGLHDNLFDSETWEHYHWSIFDPVVEARIRSDSDAPDQHLDALRRYFKYQLERGRRFTWNLSVAEPSSPIRYVLFGGDCTLTSARLLIEQADGKFAVRLNPKEIRHPKPGVRYDELMFEPGDGRVTKPSLLARQTLDPSAPQHEDSFLPVAYSFFLCESHNKLTNNVNFQDNLLNVLLTRNLPWEMAETH